MSTHRIPVASVDLSGNEEQYAVDAIRSTWISSTGAYLDRLEAEFAGLDAWARIRHHHDRAV